jgi:predicted ATPase/class 3 adenylate cyclase
MTQRAVVFTDVVDSTRLVERLGDERAAEVWAQHDRRARELIAAHRGREIDRTDGFFLLFDDALDAARFALAYHDALRTLGMTTRVGLHVGAVTLRENSPQDVARGAKRFEVEGLAKPLAARVMALAQGGQTLLTASAREALGAALPDGAHVELHGYYRLKGIQEPVDIYEIGADRTVAFAPPPDSEKAYRVVRTDDLWLPVRQVRHNLPAERDTFIGRALELRDFASRLDAGQRLITVLGPGGTGKTRFVRRYGRAWLGDWPGGVYFCDLSEARSLDGIYFAVASALEVPLGRDDPAVQLGHAFAGRERCLVVLDNFEQVTEHAAATVGRWIDRAANAAFVVTTRERLHLPGEELFPIEPLPLEKEAIDLFVARARAQRPDFALNDANRVTVAEVVRLLDGLPLAIELAAARVRVLSPAQLVDRMRDRFQLIAGARGAAARQATLRAAIDWSWDLLAPWEHAALAQCSVFERGFTLEAAEAVLDLSPWPEAPMAIDAVQALVDKSLLRTWLPAERDRYDIQEPYFGMYLSIHEYAAEKLEASGHEARRAAEERHGRYFAGLGTDEAIEALSLHGGVKRRRALALELDNLVAACGRAVSRKDVSTAVAVYRAAWEVIKLQGPFAVGTVLGAQVLALDDLDASRHAEALVTRAMASWRSGRIELTRTSLEEALAVACAARDRRREGRVRGHLGAFCREQGSTQEAREHLESALAMARDAGDRLAQGATLGSLGNLHLEQGRLEEAQAHYEANLAIAREAGDRNTEGGLLGNLGNVHLERGRGDEARACYEANLAIAREVGNRHSEAVALGNLANQQGDQGRMDEAEAQGAAALAIARELGHRRHEGYLLGSLGSILSAGGRIEEARAHYDQSLAIYREVGDRRFEAITLRFLAELLVQQGRIGEAEARLREGELLLKVVGNPLELAKTLCIRGVVEVASGRLDLARAALAEVQTVAEAMGTEPDSELSSAIAKLREALA